MSTKMATNAEKIMQFLLERGTAGATDIEGANATGIKEHVYRAARITLEKKGAAGTLGERRDDGRKKPGRIYLHASFVPAEKLAEAAAHRAEREAKRIAEKSTEPATPAETPLGEQIDGGADPLFG